MASKEVLQTTTTTVKKTFARKIIEKIDEIWSKLTKILKTILIKMKIYSLKRKKKEETSSELKSKEETSSDELPMAMLETILTKLHLVDYIHASAVSVSWRTAAAQVMACNLRHPTHQVPCLMVYDGWDKLCTFFILTDRKFYETHVPWGSRQVSMLGSSYGCLIMMDENEIGNLFLFNPFSKAKIDLPLLATSYESGSTHSLLSEVFMENKHWYGLSAILSSPLTSDDCIVVIRISEKRLAFCRLGDKTWTVFQDTKTNENLYWRRSSISFHKGQLHLMSHSGFGFKFKHSVYKLGTHPKSTASNNSLSFHGDGKILRKKYLVESCLGLLLVCKYYTVLVTENGVRCRGASGFDVYRMRTSASPTPITSWDKVKSLGDQMLFLDRQGRSTSLSAKGLQGFKGNCIYFMKKVCKGSTCHAYYCAVFDLEDGSIKPFMYTSFPKESAWVTLQ